MKHAAAATILFCLVFLAGCGRTESEPLGVQPTVQSQPTPIMLESATQSSLSFSVYAPRVPADLQLQTPVVRDDGDRELVELKYVDTQKHVVLSLLNGPINCCLDQAEKRFNALTLQDGTTAYFLPTEPKYGGNILWWQTATTFLALSGPDQTKESLVALANSVQTVNVQVQLRPEPTTLQTQPVATAQPLLPTSVPVVKQSITVGGDSWTLDQPKGFAPLVAANSQGILWVQFPPMETNTNIEKYAMAPLPKGDYTIMYTPLRRNGGALSQGATRLKDVSLSSATTSADANVFMAPTSFPYAGRYEAI